MTWIVGAPTAFGYAVAISDIKATWRGRKEELAVQKVHPVGADLADGVPSVSVRWKCGQQQSEKRCESDRVRRRES